MTGRAGRGRLLVIEGPEGAGKTTQVARLASWLDRQGVSHLELREPGGTELGERIRKLVLADPTARISAPAEAALFMASRAELCERVVVPALRDGTLVTLDRFFLSTYAYQVHGRGMDESDVRAANALATSGLVPELTVLLVLRADEGLRRADSRGARDRMESSGEAFHERVQSAYEEFATLAWQQRHPECGPIVTVDAGAGEDDVESAIRAVLQRHWPDLLSVRTTTSTFR